MRAPRNMLSQHDTHNNFSQNYVSIVPPRAMTHNNFSQTYVTNVSQATVEVVFVVGGTSSGSGGKW